MTKLSDSDSDKYHTHFKISSNICYFVASILTLTLLLTIFSQEILIKNIITQFTITLLMIFFVIQLANKLKKKDIDNSIINLVIILFIIMCMNL